MPHVSPNGSYDLASSDEVKVYKEEGEEDNPSSSENLAEDKVGLVSESEEGKTSDVSNDAFPRSSKDGGTVNGKLPDNSSGSDRPIWNPMITPYPFPNGASLPSSLGSPLSMFMERPFGSPPPAHIGIPPVHIDPKTGLPRPMYPIPPTPGQFPHFYPELSSVQWNGTSGYPITSSSFRGGYPPLSDSPLSRFSPTGFLPHPGLPPGFPHPGLMSTKQELPISSDGHRHHSAFGPDHGVLEHSPLQNQKPKIKKPLNAFMLFMKEMRPKVIEECSLKESAAINQILGRRWHSLDRSEQAKYYEMARKEKELHMQLYPGWSARDNYGCHTKKKKRKRPATESDNNNSSQNADSDCMNPKKCRARFGLDQQSQWCQPCRRKKKCIRFLEEGGVYSDDENDDDNDDDDEENKSQPPSVQTDEGSDAANSPPPPSHQHRVMSNETNKTFSAPNMSSSSAAPFSRSAASFSNSAAPFNLFDNTMNLMRPHFANPSAGQNGYSSSTVSLGNG